VARVESVAQSGERSLIPPSDLDAAVTAQFVVAWAGETGGEHDYEKRLGWWRSDLVSEYGGQAFFRDLLPSTWRWASLQGAREAARRKDAEMRRENHDPDDVISLYRLGFEVDERIEERLRDLKRGGEEPTQALPGLAVLNPQAWDRAQFLLWVQGHGEVEAAPEPIGRRLKGPPPGALAQQIRKLVAALAPLAEIYPLPHFRSAP
jgi:hypothetical protein